MIANTAATSRFAKKAVLVTGAAGGIGLAIARRLLREGGRVCLTDIDADRLRIAVEELSRESENLHALEVDLASA